MDLKYHKRLNLKESMKRKETFESISTRVSDINGYVQNASKKKKKKKKSKFINNKTKGIII